MYRQSSPNSFPVTPFTTPSNSAPQIHQGVVQTTAGWRLGGWLTGPSPPTHKNVMSLDESALNDAFFQAGLVQPPPPQQQAEELNFSSNSSFDSEKQSSIIVKRVGANQSSSSSSDDEVESKSATGLDPIFVSEPEPPIESFFDSVVQPDAEEEVKPEKGFSLWRSISSVWKKSTLKDTHKPTISKIRSESVAASKELATNMELAKNGELSASKELATSNEKRLEASDERPTEQEITSFFRDTTSTASQSIRPMRSRTLRRNLRKSRNPHPVDDLISPSSSSDNIVFSPMETMLRGFRKPFTQFKGDLEGKAEVLDNWLRGLDPSKQSLPSRPIFRQYHHRSHGVHPFLKHTGLFSHYALSDHVAGYTARQVRFMADRIAMILGGKSFIIIEVLELSMGGLSLQESSKTRLFEPAMDDYQGLLMAHLLCHLIQDGLDHWFAQGQPVDGRKIDAVIAESRSLLYDRFKMPEHPLALTMGIVQDDGIWVGKRMLSQQETSYSGIFMTRLQEAKEAKEDNAVRDEDDFEFKTKPSSNWRHSLTVNPFRDSSQHVISVPPPSPAVERSRKPYHRLLFNTNVREDGFMQVGSLQPGDLLFVHTSEFNMTPAEAVEVLNRPASDAPPPFALLANHSASRLTSRTWMGSMVLMVEILDGQKHSVYSDTHFK